MVLRPVIKKAMARKAGAKVMVLRPVIKKVMERLKRVIRAIPNGIN